MIANASVIVTKVDTGIAITVKTNGAGDYEVPSLRVGMYSIRARGTGVYASRGDKPIRRGGGRVRIDLTLKVGQASATTVEVSDVALQAETKSNERVQTISGYQTEALPLVSRNVSDLLGIVTGSRQAPTAAMTSSISS